MHEKIPEKHGKYNTVDVILRRGLRGAYLSEHLTVIFEVRTQKPRFRDIRQQLVLEMEHLLTFT